MASGERTASAEVSLRGLRQGRKPMMRDKTYTCKTRIRREQIDQDAVEPGCEKEKRGEEAALR
jgi:hypothetical protein